MTPHQINLNADLGESFGAWTMGDDSALLQIVKSANVACGFHAGDPTVMQTTVRQAIAQGHHALGNRGLRRHVLLGWLGNNGRSH